MNIFELGSDVTNMNFKIVDATLKSSTLYFVPFTFS